MFKKPEIIVALDTKDFDSAKKIVDAIGEKILYYKVGLESFVLFGHKLIEYLKLNDKKVFLDLKFHDIPNTVSGAVTSAAEIGIDILNLHCQGGFDMMKTASDNLKSYCEKRNILKPILIGVTLLTSLDSKYFSEMKLNWDSTEDYVGFLARSARDAGLDGVVSSAKEVKYIKQICGENFLTITPGIRPAFAGNDDQKRIVTPGDAVKLKTDFMVIGRPITKHENPALAVDMIKEEMK
ncbi:MAG: orotidine-5-phosphate decarboxylase [Deferribacteres bacterium]|jgi:orotidine-5'-phosphate decarboxylase|nr:orotidine-5-phosphate decarboxylase [Deferribacteres bacterium]